MHLMNWSHVFVDGFVSLRDCVLCQFTWQYQRGCSLDISCSHCRFLCVLAASSSLRADSLKNILNKAVQYLHCSLWYSDLWVHLLQYFVDVDVVWFMSLSSAWSSSRFSFCRHNDLFVLSDWLKFDCLIFEFGDCSNFISWYIPITTIKMHCLAKRLSQKKILRETNWSDDDNYYINRHFWMRFGQRSSWMVIRDFCCSVSGLAHFSHLLWTPIDIRMISFIRTFEWISVFITHQWALDDQTFNMNANIIATNGFLTHIFLMKWCIIKYNICESICDILHLWDGGVDKHLVKNKNDMINLVESVQSTSLSLQCVYNIQSSDGFTFSVIAISDCISHHILQEALQNSAWFFID